MPMAFFIINPHILFVDFLDDSKYCGDYDDVVDDEEVEFEV